MRWGRTFRIIPSRYPPIDLFERIAHPADWDQLAALEGLTNPRLRDEWGDISLVPTERRLSGPGASYVMAAFTYINRRGSRFSDGQYGVYYASKSLDGAIAETAYHMGRFYAETSDPPHREDVRVLIGKINADLHDIRVGRQWAACHTPDDYTASRALARALRDGGSNGIVYRSARCVGAENFGVFWPDVVRPPIQGAHLQYEWNGERIARYFDYAAGHWIAL